ncbi:MAG TPA: pyruvate:ferredoxin (flavodoxin) oxidoreductase [Bacteroidales bacterium]|nr:pyruvate:ferredoxin (flavodoxin) oxidoreductase [Bacteroidales bacterium]HOU95744.1 pyruvate:ferredoxin (flavodoxin) oxidoreductase [Bacteroidales bacterium]HQG36728.1 pyruvate:ferredoxin (flavodoxin) oxidoreductase [Bacteroidales bacterium]HQG52868.1 pyruvate:ferredoxin (flavodoxin) oxidoreductase [Bacteroidales bacterium]HQJ20187.1 pyruvate:ferredoxin (flavodoxin) oxidoreductase [Bacteroidales bacterium]
MGNKKFIVCDGNQAAAHIAYMFSEVACIYPITPSSTMAEFVDEWAANGLKNIFGETVKVVEMQSEAGAAGAVHGALQAGALCSTFTASQGLLLMIPNMYKISGELLPAVFHVSARTVAAHALSIFGDHSDIYATRQTGFAMLASSSPQEIMDLAGVAHLSAIKSRIPFLHFFDGFRSSAEIQKIELLEQDDLKKLIDWEALEKFRNNALNPEKPVIRGTAQNPDIFFQAREASNKFYEPVADIVANYMKEISKLTGREYKPFTYYGAPDAENIIIAMGSITETAKETIDYLAQKGEKAGIVTVHLYRPLSAKYFFDVIPKTVKRISVLDRTKEPGANGDPLYLDIKGLFYDRDIRPQILAGRYGLSSKDTTPAMVISVYENMKQKEPRDHFTIGIVDDVTFQSLPQLPEINTSTPGTYSAKFFGIGSDGTVGANKNSIKIIGETTDKYCQGYFAYDSKKSGGLTVSHLRFGDHPIRSPYYVNTPDFVACHVPAYLNKYDMLKGLKKGGTFLLNSLWDAEETKKRLPDHMKKYLAENNIDFYIINATSIAEEIGLGTRTNTIMQSAFFKVSQVIPYEKAVDEMKKAIYKTYGRKGDRVVEMNYKAVYKGGEVTKVDVSPEWANIKIEKMDDKKDIPPFIRDVVEPINKMEGDSLPVSVFSGREDGSFPPGTSAYEKRGIAVNVPEWVPEYCIQCNQCAYVCPHAAIRPFLLTEEEASKAPEGTKLLQGIPGVLKAYKYRLQVSVYDCTGCGICENVCPTKTKALVMKPLETQLSESERWTYMHEKVGYKDNIVDKFLNVKNSQFAQPLFEFSGACSGCGETPYIKLITQLFGDRMTIANATGCSSIYGASAPSMPYTINKNGHGPAWANSLFEDNAEYGYGMALGSNKLRERIAIKMQEAISNKTVNTDTEVAFKEWLEVRNDAEVSKTASAKVVEACEKDKSQIAKDILSLKQYLVKKSHWIIGGDGWAYDIGFGGLDHVIASREDLNMLVLDTEVYSNTGGQSSKSTPAGAIAKFAASGKKIKKKDLGMMAISYGYVYVAQVAMGANNAQFLKAVREAEAYPGPSLIIAYSPCINHGLVEGMSKAMEQEERAVQAGYWHLYRYNPLLEAEGKNPFILDSKEPDWSKFQEFLHSEVRYNSLLKTFPEEAEILFKAAEENAKWRYQAYQRLALQYEQATKNAE